MEFKGKINTEKIKKARQLAEEFIQLQDEIMSEIEQFTGKLNYFLEDPLEPFYPWQENLFELHISNGYLVVTQDGEIVFLTKVKRRGK